MQKNFYHNARLSKFDLENDKLLVTQPIGLKKNVDINKLLNRLKVDVKNEKKKKIVTLLMVLLTISTMGIFLSFTN